MHIQGVLSEATRQAAGEEIARKAAPSIERGRTLFICTTDLVALGLMTELQRSDINVPNDVLVIGVDDDEFSEHIYPSLTT